MTALATGLKNFITLELNSGAMIAIDRNAIVAVEYDHDVPSVVYCEGGHKFIVDDRTGLDILDKIGS